MISELVIASGRAWLISLLRTGPMEYRFVQDRKGLFGDTNLEALVETIDMAEQADRLSGSLVTVLGIG